MMYLTTDKPISSLTICAALTTKPITYRNYKGLEVSVPVNVRVYVDMAAGVALIGSDHVDIGDDEFTCVDN